MEEAKVAEAEQLTIAAQAKANQDASDPKSVDIQRPADEKTAQGDKQIGRLATSTPSERVGEATPRPNGPDVSDLPRMLLTELRRVGCNTGTIDDKWNAVAQKSLALFNKNAQTNFDVKVASLDALDAVRANQHGYVR